MEKLILEDINRIKYISSYNLIKTSEENKINLMERDYFRGFKDLLGTDAGAFRSFKGEIDMMLSPSKNLKIFASDGKQLKTTNEVLNALRMDRISVQSMIEISAETFKQTKNQKNDTNQILQRKRGQSNSKPKRRNFYNWIWFIFLQKN